MARTIVKCAAATSSRLAYRRRPEQQLRQLGAKIAAIRRASSLVSSLAAERPTGFVLEIDAGEA
jgi:hypothetical protein